MKTRLPDEVEYVSAGASTISANDKRYRQSGEKLCRGKDKMFKFISFGIFLSHFPLWRGRKRSEYKCSLIY